MVCSTDARILRWVLRCEHIAATLAVQLWQHGAAQCRYCCYALGEQQCFHLHSQQHINGCCKCASSCLPLALQGDCTVCCNAVIFRCISEAIWTQKFCTFFGLDADMRDTDVCGNLHRAGWCILLDALIAVGGEISKSARTCFREYLQCADLTFPNFKATASSRLKPHAKSTVRILMNTNRSNFSKGNVGSRLGATEWTGSLRKCPRIACLKWRKDSDKASE